MTNIQKNKNKLLTQIIKTMNKKHNLKDNQTVLLNREIFNLNNKELKEILDELRGAN